MRLVKTYMFKRGTHFLSTRLNFNIPTSNKLPTEGIIVRTIIKESNGPRITSVRDNIVVVTEKTVSQTTLKIIAILMWKMSSSLRE